MAFGDNLPAFAVDEDVGEFVLFRKNGSNNEAARRENRGQENRYEFFIKRSVRRRAEFANDASRAAAARRVLTGSVGMSEQILKSPRSAVSQSVSFDLGGDSIIVFKKDTDRFR